MNNMKNRFITVYSIIATFVLIFSLSFFGYNLYNEYSINSIKSQTKYETLLNDLRTISYNNMQNDSEYSKSIQNAIGDTNDYAFIQIKRNNETVAYFPADKLREETDSLFTKFHKDELNVNKQTVSIVCTLYLIHPDSIYYYAKISFLMVLIITVITIIMIVYLKISEDDSDVISYSEDFEEEAEIENNTEQEFKTPSEAEVESDVEPNYEPEIDSENEAQIKEAEEEFSAQIEAENQTKEIEKPSAEVTPEEVQAIFAEPLTDEQQAKLPIEDSFPQNYNENQNADSEPTGLFDPQTGIGWESYLHTRLDNEIDRATASEIDLSLFVIKLAEITTASEEYKNVCNYLAIQFQFKDLLFERNQDSIVALKISMNIDEALNLADKLYSDICNIINSQNCRIGISSRSIRMVTGDRLLLESEQALVHTDSSSPIIAFRVDSEKYRQLMEQNQA